MQPQWLPGTQVCNSIVDTSAPLPWRRNAHSVGAAGADRSAGDGVETFVEADFDGREEVVPAADGDAVARERRIGAGEKRDDFVRRHRCLRREITERGWNRDGVDGGARCVEEIICVEAGAGAVRMPLVLKEPLVWIDVAEGGWLAGPRRVRAVFRVAAVGVLRPEAMEHEG